MTVLDWVKAIHFEESHPHTDANRFFVGRLDHMNIVVWPVTVPNVVPIMSPRKPQGVVAAEKCHEENFVQTNVFEILYGALPQWILGSLVVYIFL